jgi:alpha-beta hydrolase superfamily lysophospholipase
LGSYVAQAFLIDHVAEIQATVLSGSNGKPPPIATIGRVLSRLERMRIGERGTSRLLTNLSFGAFNKQFAPNRTAFDWLSRDNAEVDKYVADPLCGFPVSTALWVDLLDSLAAISKPKLQTRIPKDLPVYIFAGALDPVSEKTRGLAQLVAAYRAAGLKDVTHRFYPEARHETLNETNRDEVTRDLVSWLDSHIKK